jgi:hypothetical protein
VDAAAIGAGYVLQSSTNLNDTTQVNNIKDTAARFFNANYPARYWGSTQVYYSAAPTEDSTTHVRTVYVKAAENVPMLFLRVVGINNSKVAAQASTKVRFVTMMIVVDRSGSVQRAGNDGVVKTALTNFIVNTPASTPPGQSPFVDGRDVIGLGSFGTNWNLDFAPVSNFRSNLLGNIGTAINNIPFGNNATNTAEGLYRGYKQLQTLNNTGALNVIVLLTDGRPSALTVTMNITSTCVVPGSKTGVITANVGQTWPPLPPQNQGDYQDAASRIYQFGLFNPAYTGLGNLIGGADLDWTLNSLGCHYATDGGPLPGSYLYNDIASFPATDAYGNSTTGPVYQGEGTSTSDPRAVRYASFNAADNMARTIRQDTTLRPVLFVIGLNEPPSGGEPLDADWLARVANDPSYKDSNGNSVYQSGQTSGMYYNVTGSGLQAAFQDISSQILRLAQ